MGDDELRAGRELDAACARALGWKDVENCYVNSPFGGYDDWMGYPPEVVAAHKQYKGKHTVPKYSSKRKHARFLEDEIERRGRWHLYVDALIAIVLDQTDAELWMVAHVTRADLWEITRATPEQRARAFLEAVSHA